MYNSTASRRSFYIFIFVSVLCPFSQSNAMKRSVNPNRFIKPVVVSRQFCLHCPIVEGDEHGMRDALRKGADVDELWGSQSAVALAIEHNQPYIASILINQENANPHLGNIRTGKTPLHLAAQKNGVALCEDLIMRGADVDARDKKGRTPLHDAAEYGGQKVCDLLLEYGADLQARDNEGRIPALKKGLVEKIKIVLGINVPDQKELDRETRRIKDACKDRD